MTKTIGSIAMAGFMVLLTLPMCHAEAPKSTYHSPSGHFDLVFDTVADDWRHVRKAIPGAALECRDLYSISLIPAGARDAVNVLYYADLPPAPSPEELLQAMIWSPGERFVVLPDKQKARQGHHRFQLVAPLDAHKVWSLEGDHLHWIDDRRFVGDLNTTEVPGGIMVFDTQAAKADLLIPADNGIGYQVSAVQGSRVTVQGFVNKAGENKTAWDAYTPACFDLNLETLKKSSVPCP